MAPRPASTRSHRRRSAGGETVLMTRTVLCTMAGISETQLAVWEREDLLAPDRLKALGGRAESLYSREAIRRVRLIRTLAEELEVNLPGIGVILHLLDRMER
ncbi:MAG: chaperone modulator CbpM [Terriglobales bacterium]